MLLCISRIPYDAEPAIPELDEAFEVWLQARTHAALQAAASRVQHIAAHKLPYIPLLTPNDVWVHTRELQGWHPFAANLYPFYQDARLDS